MFLGSTKEANQNAEATAPSASDSGVVSAKPPPPIPLLTKGVLTSNMGNIMAQQPSGTTGTGKAGGASMIARPMKRERATDAVNNKLGLGLSSLSSAGSHVPLQPRGNPTFGSFGALRGPTAGRGVFSTASQIMAGGLPHQPPLMKPSMPQKTFARPAQRFKIRKDPQLVDGTHGLIPRRPFAGKAVEVAGPSTATTAPQVSISIDETDKSLAALSVTEVEAPKPTIVAESSETLEADVVGFLPKPKSDDVIIDIDLCDDNRHLTVPEYVNDIMEYLMGIETRNFNVKERYLDNTGLTGRQRAILIDWLLQVHMQFGWKQETMFIAASLMDRFLVLDGNVERTELQLVGCTCLFIAIKYEEISVPRAQELTNCSDGAFTPEDVLKMEIRVLNTVECDLSMPIPPIFLRRCSKAAGVDINVHQIAKFFTELAMVDYSACHIPPSMVAAASLALAMMIWDRKSLASVWNATVQHYSKYTTKEIIPFVAILRMVVINAYENPANLKGVRRKYSSHKFYRVSCLPIINPSSWKTWLGQELEAAKKIFA